MAISAKEQAYVNRMKYLLKQGAFAEAANGFANYPVEFSHKNHAKLKHAFCLIALKRFDEAVKIINSLQIETFDDDARAHYVAVNVIYKLVIAKERDRQFAFANTLSDFSAKEKFKVGMSEPKALEALAYLLMLLAPELYKPFIEQAYRRLEVRHPNFNAGALSYARWLELQEDHVGALRKLNSIKILPGNKFERIYLTKARLLQKMQRHDEAPQLLKYIIDNSKEEFFVQQAYYMLALMYENEKKINEAEACFLRAVLQDKAELVLNQNWRTQIDFAVFLQIHFENFDDSFLIIEHVIETLEQPDLRESTSSYDLARAYHIRGLCFANQKSKSIPDAIADFDKALELAPDFAAAISSRTKTLTQEIEGRVDRDLQIRGKKTPQARDRVKQLTQRWRQKYIEANRLDLGRPLRHVPKQAEPHVRLEPKKKPPEPVSKPVAPGASSQVQSAALFKPAAVKPAEGASSRPQAPGP